MEDNWPDDDMAELVQEIDPPADKLPQQIEIEYVDPKALNPAEFNPRVLAPKAKAKLKRGIEKFGLVDPILVRRSDLLIIGGHSRHQCALELKLERVPVVFLDDMGDADLKALMVLLNNAEAQGEWDRNKLADILAELNGGDFEYDATVTGFDERALEQLSAVSGAADILPTEYKAPTPTPHITYGIYDIPMSAEEDARFKKLVQEYVAERGVMYGFVSFMLKRMGR